MPKSGLDDYALVSDQILIGTNMSLLRTTALDKGHDLQAVISHARKLEASEEATKLIDRDALASFIAISNIESDRLLHFILRQIKLVNKGKVFQKMFKKAKSSRPRNYNSSSVGCGRNNCDRGNKCIARNAFCKACGKKAISQQSVCQQKGKYQEYQA